MRSLISIGLFVILANSIFAQGQPQVLATATGHTITMSDLSQDTRNLISGLPAAVAKTRADLFAQMVDNELIAAEAKARGIDATKLIADLQAKAAEPTDAEINALYQANLAAFDNKPLKDVREQLVSYLKTGNTQKEFLKLVDALRTKYKVVPGKDVNAAGLKGTDIVVTVNGKAITDLEFEERNKLEIFETSADVYDQVLSDINELLYSALVMDEAKALGTDSGSLIANEVTSKMRDYSDQERSELENAYRERLFAKYNVKILYAEPAPVVQNISAGNGASRGPATAPVTVIMFSDFQCPACSATHPILKKVLAEYPGKVRFVVRNYPLTNRHEHAFRAALAAAAANAQGKFFEFADILYTNQSALDDEALRKYAAGLGLNMKQFELDFSSEKTAAEVRKDIADGNSYHVGGTPTIYVNGVMVRDLSSSGFRKAINRALGKK